MKIVARQRAGTVQVEKTVAGKGKASGKEGGKESGKESAKPAEKKGAAGKATDAKPTIQELMSGDEVTKLRAEVNVLKSRLGEVPRLRAARQGAGAAGVARARCRRYWRRRPTALRAAVPHAALRHV